MYDVRKNRLYILICIAHFLHWCVCQHNFPKLKHISLTDQKWSIPFYAFWGVVPWNIQRPRSAWHRPSSYHTSNPARCSGIADAHRWSKRSAMVSTLLHMFHHVSSCFCVLFLFAAQRGPNRSCHVMSIQVQYHDESQYIWIFIFALLYCFNLKPFFAEFVSPRSWLLHRIWPTVTQSMTLARCIEYLKRGKQWPSVDGRTLHHPGCKETYQYTYGQIDVTYSIIQHQVLTVVGFSFPGKTFIPGGMVCGMKHMEYTWVRVGSQEYQQFSRNSMLAKS